MVDSVDQHRRQPADGTADRLARAERRQRDGAAVPGGLHSRRLHHLFFVQPRILAVVRARAGCAGGLLYPRLGGDRHRGVRRRDARDAAIAGMSGERAIVADEDGGIRLDRWFKRHRPGTPHALIARWARSGELTVDGRKADVSDRIEAGQTIAMPVPPAAPRSEEPTSELQSLMRISYAVFCLKKKKKQTNSQQERN